MATSPPPIPDLSPTKSIAQSPPRSPSKSPSKSYPQSPTRAPLKSPIKASSQEYPDSPTITPQVEPLVEGPTTTGLEELETMASESRNHQGQQLRSQMRTPDPQARRSQAGGGQLNGQRANVQTTPSTPGHLPPFDWDDLESRYEQALAEASEQDKELLQEFESLVKVRTGFARETHSSAC